jgi:hypothetical protein
VAVGKEIFSKFSNKPKQIRANRQKRQINQEEQLRWENKRNYYCPYEKANRAVVTINDERYN